MRFSRLLPLGTSLTLLPACSSAPVDAPPTSVRVTAAFESALQLTQLSLRTQGHETTVPPKPELLKPAMSVVLLVDDTRAGIPLELSIFGLAQSQPVVYGKTSVKPVLHQVTDVRVTLSRLPCGAWCTAGATGCAADGVKTCEERDTDTCLEWSTPIACPKEAPYCSLGQCSATCVDECSAGSARCAGSGALERCGQGDQDSCLDWLPEEPCPQGTACENGICKKGACADECKAGEAQCAGAGVARCGQFDGDECLEWGPPVPCEKGQSCSKGVCSTSCKDECTESMCEGLVWKQCGQFDLDACNELSAGISCAPADSCQEGACDAKEGCSSAPLVCAMPPKNECVDATTLRVYAQNGTCSGGACDYAPKDIACPNCPACDACAGVTCNKPPAPSACYNAAGTCNDGSCSYAFNDGASCDDGDSCTAGDSCLSGVCAGKALTCATPPAPTCVSATILRTYAMPGSCATGTCTYPYTDTACASGCDQGACKTGPVTPVAVDLGGAHSCALTSLGGIKCWGSNGFGQLGNGSTMDSSVPMMVTGLGVGATALSAGLYHTCALNSNQGALCWGDNHYGQLGNTSMGLSSPVPVDVQGLSSGMIALGAGGYHTCGLTNKGGVKCWGSNNVGQLGNGSGVDTPVPVDVQGLSSGVTAISAGGNHTCALTNKGGVKCWGSNNVGQLGSKSTTLRSLVPVDVQGLSSGVTALSAGSGSDHTCALLDNGGIKCWGRNNYGQLGNDSLANSPAPVSVQGLAPGVTALGAGSNHTCALLSNGGVQCWGSNDIGQLGNDATLGSGLHPLNVQKLASGVTALGAGGNHTCALLSNGGIQCWGSNDGGQLGNSSKPFSSSPVDVAWP